MPARTYGEPTKDPTFHRNGYDVYTYENDTTSPVLDVHIVEYPDDGPYMRQWIALGVGPVLVLKHYEEHKYGPSDNPPDPETCCTGYAGDELTTDRFSEPVKEILLAVTDAPVVGPEAKTVPSSPR